MTEADFEAVSHGEPDELIATPTLDAALHEPPAPADRSTPAPPDDRSLPAPLSPPVAPLSPVAAALVRLDELPELELPAHAEVYQHIHGELQRALATIDDA